MIVELCLDSNCNVIESSEYIKLCDTLQRCLTLITLKLTHATVSF